MNELDNTNPEGLRIIKTARSQEAINEAVKEGFWPLVKPVMPSPDIKSKYAVYQNTETGEINVVHDYRMQPSKPFDRIIDFNYYYPYHFEQPYAAYLIPKDIENGERVVLEDLIEDVIGMTWNQDSSTRLQSGFAHWNGKDFNLDKPSPMQIIG